jgi:hypothetical protein
LVVLTMVKNTIQLSNATLGKPTQSILLRVHHSASIKVILLLTRSCRLVFMRFISSTAAFGETAETDGRAMDDDELSLPLLEALSFGLRRRFEGACCHAAFLAEVCLSCDAPRGSLCCCACTSCTLSGGETATLVPNLPVAIAVLEVLLLMHTTRREEHHGAGYGSEYLTLVPKPLCKHVVW